MREYLSIMSYIVQVILFGVVTLALSSWFPWQGENSSILGAIHFAVWLGATFTIICFFEWLRKSVLCPAVAHRISSDSLAGENPKADNFDAMKQVDDRKKSDRSGVTVSGDWCWIRHCVFMDAPSPCPLPRSTGGEGNGCLSCAIGVLFSGESLVYRKTK